ncbi:uncharacterized protein LOC122048338 [Zingiber officinale]|uniref:uncharacterized protein LOC122048338 n=1 Tax=Zingiber officinale TaxID=94328 RepID=UPI001C4C4B82|nr:uncharacterized protein LOC122048338 [Zingiber officinale]
MTDHLLDPDAFARLMTTPLHRRDHASAPEDRLTSLHNDLLISILSFLPIKQRVALSAVCSRLLRLLPSIPRLDAFRLEVVNPSGGVDISQHFTFPRALIRQCHIVFHKFTYLSKRLEQLLVEDLVEVGVQDLILETAGERLLNLSGKENCGFFGLKSLRSLSLLGISVGRFDGHPHPPPIACTLLTSLKIKHCDLHRNDFLRAFLISCPFLETLHFFYSFEYGDNLSIHSGSIKHLVLLFANSTVSGTINVRCPNLESLTVNVASELRIEAPKVRNASLLLGLYPSTDPPDALMKILGAHFGTDDAWLMLNSNPTPNGLTAEHEIDRILSPECKEDAVIFNFDFDLKDQSSAMILTQFLKKLNHYNTRFDIRVDAMHIQSTNEMARDDHLLHSSTYVELIKLRMIISEKRFEEFLSKQKRMEEALKRTGLQKLKSRTSEEQFNDILVSNESLVEVSSSITNCIEIKF